MNQALFEWIFSVSHKSPLLDAGIVFLASYLPYAFVVVWLWFLIKFWKGWRRRLFFVIETLLSVVVSRGIATETVRFFYEHARPFLALNVEPLIRESSNSFPSGHAAVFFALAAVIFFYHRRLGGWLFVLTAVNGLARIAAGVHWPFDIVGGIVVAVASAFLVHRMFKKYREELHLPNEKTA